MSRFESFREFATLIISDADRFRESYNRAIRDYRTVNKLKSRNHPAPELEADELPFWSMIDGTRRRTYHGADLDNLRPKALILTLFARLILGDFFIHGLGGGKYDVVTDAIIGDFFAIEPPAFQILTATLHLPFKGNQNPTRPLADVNRLERDLHWNPQRHLQSESAAARHQAIVQMPQSTHEERRARFRLFRELAEELRGTLTHDAESLKETKRSCESLIHQNEILTRRDYAWVLYPESVLKPFLTSFL